MASQSRLSIAPKCMPQTLYQGMFDVSCASLHCQHVPVAALLTFFFLSSASAALLASRSARLRACHAANTCISMGKAG